MERMEVIESPIRNSSGEFSIKPPYENRLLSVVDGVRKMVRAKYIRYATYEGEGLREGLPQWDDGIAAQGQIMRVIGWKVKKVIEEIGSTADIEYLSNVRDWLRTFIEEVFIKYFTGRKDLHTDNLGINNNGQLRYFDPTFI